MAIHSHDWEDEEQELSEPEEIRGEADAPPPIDHASVPPLTAPDETEGG